MTDPELLAKKLAFIETCISRRSSGADCRNPTTDNSYTTLPCPFAAEAILSAFDTTERTI